MADQDLREFVKQIEAQNRRRAERKIDSYDPYLKQLEFHDAGREHRERLFRAEIAPQLGTR